MKLKKLLAAVTAAALAVSTMLTTSFTASAKTSFGTGTWSDGKFVDNASTEMEGVSLVGVDKVTFNATASDLNYGWNGGQFYTNSNGKDYTSVTFGGSNKNATVTLEETGPFSVDVEIGVTDTGWFECGWGTDCAEGVFDLTSIDFYKGADKVGTWADGAYTEASSEDDDLPKNEWFKNEYGSDAYICTNGNAPEEALFVDVEALLDEGKTLADVSKITAIYAVSSINEAEQGVSGCFGVVHDVGGTNDWYDDIYSEWEWLASDSTAEEGKDCVIECADGLLDTDECQFQIDTMKTDNVLVVQFQIEYKDDGGDAEIPEGKKITLAENSWGEGGPDNTNWQGMDSVAIEGITNWTTTATEAMEKLDSLEFSFPVNGAISNGQVFDVSKLSFQGVLQTSDGCWKTFDGSVAEGKVTISIPDIDSALADYTGSVNIAVVVNTAYSNSANEIDVYIGDVTVKTGSDEPAPPVDPDGEVLFSGNAAANTSVSGSKVSKYKDDAVITVKYMPAATEAEFIEAAQITAEEMEYPANTGTIAGQLDADPWWCQPAESAYWSVASSEAFGNEQTFTITVADYLASIGRTELPYELVFCPWNGTKITKVTIKGDLKSSEPDDPKPDDPKPDDPKPEDPKPDNTVTTPSERVTYSVVIPFGYTPATDEEITNAVSSTAEGDTASVNLTSNTRVDKAVLDTIAGKDITVEFKLKGGAKWVINGKNVEKAKKVDLGVRLRSKAIPAEKVSTVAGDNRTVQFSLRHNGDLGFTGALIIPFSSAYNSKFANLYYYNESKGELEFVGSSKISAGQASFVFTHASDYVVVIDDEAYGEDVSSAAGVYETSEMTAAPYVAAVAVIAILGAAAVVIKKRFAK